MTHVSSQKTLCHTGRIRFTRLPLLMAALMPLLLLAGCNGLSGNNATLSGKIRISGSTALQPLAQQAAKDFVKLHPQVTIDVQGGGSFVGLDQMYAGQVDIGDSDVYADPTRYPDPAITDHLVAVVPFAMIVHSDISLTTLTQDQIMAIYTGQIRNWRDVGGPDEPIIVVSRALTSGSRATFRKYILNGADEVQGLALDKDSSQALVDTVSKTKGAIGYVASSAVTSAVREVAINGVLPTPTNIENGRYSFWSYEHMYTRGLPTGAVAAFLDFMLTAQEQQVAAALAYIPISAMHPSS
ncbi:MAG TPA: phosphate ABC transporter substrate-binding protein [Ktedonobacterales bacterium]|nr:phosphate ABC transporter substrate-binding protein [Ktedonobacterales bacterium]